MPREQPKKALYHASAYIGGKKYQATGITLEEAVFNLNPAVKKGVCILSITHGDIKIEKILSGKITYKLFGETSRFMREIALKNLKTLFPI